MDTRVKDGRLGTVEEEIEAGKTKTRTWRHGKQCETRESGSYCKSYSNDGETQDHRGGSEEDRVPEYEGNR